MLQNQLINLKDIAVIILLIYDANNSIVIMHLNKKEEEKKSTIQVSDRLNDSLNQMEIKGESYEDTIWLLIQY